MAMRSGSALLTLSATTLALLAVAGCKDDPDGNAPPINMADGTGVGTGGDGGPATDGESGSSDGADSTGESGASTGEPLPNCGDIVCTGNGACEVDVVGAAYCACDDGYVLDDDGDECVVDRSCVALRFLEERCRQYFNAEPAVSLFFALDFCAGTAVTQQWVDTLGIEFVILENGVDITKNVESEATIINQGVESFVTLVLDMSGSVAESKDLPALVAAMREMMATIEPQAGDAPVAVSLYVFGRFVRELQPFTRDFAEIDAALAAIEADPDAITAMVNPNGTSLYEAVRVGINRTQRIRDLRAAVTWDGVLSTGTVIVVTDGNDTSNAVLDTAQIDSTLNQVISIGISNAVDDDDLSAIGRDGSFLAPTPTDWVAAFEDVASRVHEYPDRGYLLAYCSSATSGSPEVTVTVDAPGLRVAHTTTCNFIADAFGTDPGLICTGELFASECAVRQCGGLTACGACADDECCDGNFCIAPVSIDAFEELSCDGADQFCAATDPICVPDGDNDTCEDPDVLGGACNPGCEPGTTWCQEGEDEAPDQCVAAEALGEDCESAQECQSLNCQTTNPDNPFEEPTCQPPALLFDRCAGADTVCEAGGYCQGTQCVPQRGYAESCSGAVQCRSGRCEAPVTNNVCTVSQMCYWPWSDKLP